MASIHELVNTVMAQVPEAPEPLVIEAYRAAARKFFADTSVWTDTDMMFVPNTFAAPTATVAFDILPGDGQEVVDAVWVSYAGRMLDKQTLAQMRHRGSSAGAPRYYRVAIGTNMLVMAPAPTEADSEQIAGQFVLRPSRKAEELPDEIVEAFSEPLEYGALQRLLGQPNQDWANLEAAAYYAVQFHEAIDYWRSHAVDEGMRGVARTVRYGGY